MTATVGNHSRLATFAVPCLDSVQATRLRGFPTPTDLTIIDTATGFISHLEEGC